MLNGLAGLRAFPWGFPAPRLLGDETVGRLAWRLTFSLMTLNMLPLLIFAWGYSALSAYKPPSDPFWQLVLVGLAALVVFAPYRLYHAAIVGWRESPYLRLYSPQEYKKVKEDRALRESTCGHLFGTAIYSVPFSLMMCLLSGTAAPATMR
jgi:FtsH-binding integral membrane protein